MYFIKNHYPFPPALKKIKFYYAYKYRHEFFGCVIEEYCH